MKSNHHYCRQKKWCRQPSKLNDTKNRMYEVKQRAFSEYDRRLAAIAPPPIYHNSTPTIKKQKRSYRQHILAIAFMITDVIYTAVSPPAIMLANTFLRKAVIWINDTFHMSFEINDPYHEFGFPAVTFYSHTRALAQLKSPLPILDTSTGFKIDSITVATDSDDISFITLEYMRSNERLTLTFEPLMGHSVIAPPTQAVRINSSSGTIWVWPLKNDIKAVGINKTWYLEVRGYCSMETAISALSTLTWLS